MVGFSNAREAAILDAQYNTTLYLRLLTGTAGQCVNDDGTLPAGCTELTTGGYAPLSVPAAAWNSAVGGSPTTKTVPNAGHSPLSFTPTGAIWHVCAYAWTTDNSAISAGNFVSTGVMVDVNNTPMLETVLDGQTLSFTNQYPIVERLGDPPIGVNPI